MIDPKTACLPHMPIVEAMRRLNAMTPPQYVLVVDEAGRLCGTITDGDVRRAILRGVDLSSPVSACMSTKPIVVTNENRHQAIRQLKEKSITFVPVVDAAGVLLDVVTGQRIVTDDVSVILMAGGLGTRLRERTVTIPKPLLRVAGRPILQRIVEKLEAAGFRRIYISVNYLADQIIEFFHQHQPAAAEIRFLREEMRMGTAGALSLLPARPTGPILVANADLVTEIDFEALLQFHFEHDYHATVGVAIHVVDMPYGVIECDERGLIQAIREKPRLDYFVNAGLYVLMPEVWDLIPARTFIDMPEVLNRAIEKGLQVGAFPIHEYWVDVGRHHDLAQVQRDWSDEWPEG